MIPIDNSLFILTGNLNPRDCSLCRVSTLQLHDFCTTPLLPLDCGFPDADFARQFDLESSF